MALTPALEALLAPCQVVVQTPVHWGAMDAFQHVNNTVYFRYFEDARLAYFAKVGMIDYMEAHQVGPILASTQCRFKMPLRYPDVVHVGARVVRIGEDRFDMAYVVASERREKIAAEGGGLIVSYDYEAGRKVSLPAPWRDAIEALDGPLEPWTKE